MPALLGFMPRWGWIALGAVLLMAAFYFALDAYGDSRYREGKKDADAAWQEANNRLVAKAAKAANEADKNAVFREIAFADRQEAERKRIEQTMKDGGSPFDVIFGDQP